MNLKKDEIVNRLNELVDEGRGLVRKISDDVGCNAREFGWKAKKEFVRGRRAIVSAEESIAKQAKDHPVAFMLIGFAIASVVAAALIMNTGARDED